MQKGVKGKGVKGLRGWGGVYRGYVGIMEMKMETTILGYIGLETFILCYIGFTDFKSCGVSVFGLQGLRLGSWDLGLGILEFGIWGSVILGTLQNFEAQDFDLRRS